MAEPLLVNRAPVLTLWAAIVAERLGFTRPEALTLGRAVAGMNAQAKALRLGIREPAEPEARARRAAKRPGDHVELLGRAVPVIRTKDGTFAASEGRAEEPGSVERYLAAKFGEALGPARKAMTALAEAYDRDTLADCAYALYERFRPEIPPGQRGWGAKGELDLAALARLKPRAKAAGKPRKT